MGALRLAKVVLAAMGVTADSADRPQHLDDGKLAGHQGVVGAQVRCKPGGATHWRAGEVRVRRSAPRVDSYTAMNERGAATAGRPGSATTTVPFQAPPMPREICTS